MRDTQKEQREAKSASPKSPKLIWGRQIHPEIGSSRRRIRKTPQLRGCRESFVRIRNFIAIPRPFYGAENEMPAKFKKQKNEFSRKSRDLFKAAGAK